MARALLRWMWTSAVGGVFDNDVARANAAAELADARARLLVVNDLQRRVDHRLRSAAADAARTAA